MDNRRAVPYARNLSGEGHARFVGRQREAESDALFAGVLYGNRNRTWGVIQIDMNNVGSQQNVDFIGPRSMNEIERMLEAETENIRVLGPGGRPRGEYCVKNVDPAFFLPLPVDDDPDGIPIRVGDTMQFDQSSHAGQTRVVVGVTLIVFPFLASFLRILAPRQVAKANADEPYVVARGIELRPGTTVLGGRDSGFYDDYGFIVASRHVGGDPGRGEDWVYYVVAATDFEELESQWLLRRDISFPTAGPKAVVDLPIASDLTIDSLLATGEREFLTYVASHPATLEKLTPEQFERLMVSIYKNLGFDTEPIGAWNQADGGVDVIAVAKTKGGTDFRMAIQCKASKRKVSAKPIRELAGVLDTFHAHQGVVATTSIFTPNAVREVEGTLWKIKLQDRNSILRRLFAVVRPELQKFVDRLDEGAAN